MNQNIATLIANENEELKVIPYSGRFMYGEETYAIEFPDFGTLIDAVIQATILNPDTMETARLGNVDQLGLNKVIY